MEEIVSPKNTKKLITSLVILISLLTSLIFSSWQIFTDKNKQNLQVSFLDVGQGDAILIETPNGAQTIIDTGPNGKILEELNKKIYFFDQTLDAVILTHPDLDHIGGTVDLFNAYKIPVLIFATSTKQTDATESIERINVERREVKAGDMIMLDVEKNIYLDILFPESGYINVDSNDQSIVAKLVFNEICFILTGDASKEVEMKLVQRYGTELDCEVLKVGHHGSHTSSEEKFIGFVSPEYAVISSGRENKFGHPHKETIDTLSKFPIKIINTAESGTITFYSDGVAVNLK